MNGFREVYRETALVYAAEKGHAEAVSMLLQAGADRDQTADDFLTDATLAAMQNGHGNVLKVLFPNPKPDNAEAAGGSYELVCSECSRGKIGDFQFTPLIAAAHTNHCHCMFNLIQQGADVNEVCSVVGETALYQAAINNSTECLQLLLSSGASVNGTDGYRETALVHAAERGHAEAVKVLLQYGADWRMVGDDGRETALFAALRGGHSACVQTLIQYGAAVVPLKQVETLIAAAVKGDCDMLVATISVGAYVNGGDERGTTALIHACENRQAKCVELLLNSGADVNQANHTGYTALLAATCSFHIQGSVSQYSVIEDAFVRSLQCVKLLLKAGAHVNKTNNVGFNALEKHIGVSNWSCRELIQVLIAAGETLNTKKLKHLGYDRNSDQRPVRIQMVEFLSQLQGSVNLRHRCRKAIRTHLLQLDRHLNLYCRIPYLGLPSMLSEYMLYDVDIDDVNLNV